MPRWFAATLGFRRLCKFVSALVSFVVFCEQQMNIKSVKLDEHFGAKCRIAVKEH